MNTGETAIKNFKTDIKKFKNELLDKEKFTSKIARKRFTELYSTHQKVLSTGAVWATFFDKEIISLFFSIKETRIDILEPDAADTTNWTTYRNIVISSC